MTLVDGTAEVLALRRERDEAIRERDALREGMASEARIVLAQTLDLKSLSKSRRGILTEQVKRMAAVALGEQEPRTCVRGSQTLEQYVRRFITEDMP